MFEHHKKESPIISLLGMGGGVGSYAFIRRGVDGYEIARSLRFNSADSAYLSRTPGSAGNRKTWTWAGWIKGLVDADNPVVFACTTGTTDNTYLRFRSIDGAFHLVAYNTYFRSTSAVYRDPSAWYHVVWAIDTTQATAANRVKLYVNGVEVTAFSASSNPTQNADLGINQAAAHAIGSNSGGGAHLSGYLADIHFIDGQALDPSSFGEFDTNGVWQPKAYTGSYGTNGFHLDFADNSSAAALGYDAAGSNDWTVNNLSVTAGSGNDSLRDSPTNGSQTDTGVGGVVVGNYATINPLVKNGSQSTLSNGNLDLVSPNDGNAYGPNLATINLPAQKYYWEATVTTASAAPANLSFAVGVSTSDETSTNSGSTATSTRWAYRADYSAGTVIGIAYDGATGKLWFASGNTWISSGNPSAGTNAYHTVNTALTVFPYFWLRDGAGISLNFGQRPFAYTAPSGFKALCTTNLPAPTIANGATVFEARAYTGNGTTQTLSGFQFSPDLVWLKSRASVNYHELYDTIRGGTRVLYSNVTAAEEAANGLTSFTSDGFNLGDYDPTNALNGSYIAWAWDAGTSNATNTSGSITSTVRANISAGFSVITLTTPASTGNYSIGHGLGIKPAFTIWKSRTTAGNYWFCQHQGLGNMVDYYIRLESTAAGAYSAGRWVNEPTSSLLYTNVGNTWNTSDDLVCYCFATVAGYSAFGSYIGNGSTDGPFVFTGMRPRWLLIKSSSASDWNWHLRDTARDSYNPVQQRLFPNTSSAESANDPIDILSNGFKLRASVGDLNGSGTTYIYAAFAEHPFRSARAR